jgi:hypothetical protein
MIAFTEFLILKTQRLFRPQIEDVIENWARRSCILRILIGKHDYDGQIKSTSCWASDVTPREALRNSLEFCVGNPERKESSKA